MCHHSLRSGGRGVGCRGGGPMVLLPVHARSSCDCHRTSSPASLNAAPVAVTASPPPSLRFHVPSVADWASTPRHAAPVIVIVIVVRLPLGPVIVIVVVPAVRATMLPLASTVATGGVAARVHQTVEAAPLVLLLKVAVVVSVSLPPGSASGWLALPLLPLPLPVGAVVVQAGHGRGNHGDVTVPVLLPVPKCRCHCSGCR